MLRTLTCGLAALALATAAPGRAAAQTPAPSGFALPRFDASAAGAGWFALDALDLRGDLRPAAGVMLDWGYKPLVVYNLDDTERAAIVSNQVLTHLGASLVLRDRFRAAMDLPIAGGSGSAQTVGGVLYPAPSGAAIGDLRLGGDVRIAGEYGEAVTFAAGLDVYLPIGSASQYVSDGNLRMLPRLRVAGEAGPFCYAADLGFVYRAETQSYAGTPLGSEVRLGAAAGWLGLERKLRVGPEVYGTTYVERADDMLKRRTTALEGIFGAHYRVHPEVEIGAALGTGLTRGLGTPRTRTLLMAQWSPGPLPPDRDGDTIVDAEDACPNLAGIASTDRDMNGCPDEDRDGIADARDACPADPGPASSDPTSNGCPDRDGDRIADARDACPAVPGVASADPKLNGCPPDGDRDGIVDAKDACPDVAGPASEDPALNGCPDRDGDRIADGSDACPEIAGVASADPARHGCPPDRDLDGVVDAKDLCPAEPKGDKPDPMREGCPLKDDDNDGLANSVDNCPTEAGPEKNQGCPLKKKQLVVITREKIEIKEKVFFETGKATILPRSFGLLDQVASVLVSHPEVSKILVEGHTDSTGKIEFNRQLSQDRAASVRKYLLDKGVEESRLLSQGFGPDRPADTNATAKGREKNRRVEFTILAGGEIERREEREVVEEPTLAPLTPANAPAGEAQPQPVPAIQNNPPPPAAPKN